MKFRKKPVVVEAEQFKGFYHTPYPKGVEMEDNSNNPGRERYVFYVVTAHGQKAFLHVGDWVIAEPDNRGYYPCTPDIFSATYEPVDAQPDETKGDVK